MPVTLQQKPVIIHAVQWTGDNVEEIQKFLAVVSDAKILTNTVKRLYLQMPHAIDVCDVTDYILFDPMTKELRILHNNDVHRYYEEVH